MPSLMKTLGIDMLTPSERIDLVNEILDSLEPDPPPMTEAQRQELDRRIALLDADPSGGSPWEEVEARIVARLRR